MKRRLLASVKDAIACDAFWSPDDDLCHAVVLARDGTLTDVVYDESGAVRDIATVGAAAGARDVTAFWSETDDERNVTAVTAGGQVPHFRQKGAAPWTTIRRRDVPGAVRIAGYDFHHHGIVLTEAGRITDEPFHGVTAAVQKTFVEDTAAALARSGRTQEAGAVKPPTKDEPAIEVAVLPGVVDIAALWADGQNRFVVAAEKDGAITELGYGIHQPQTRRVLAVLPGAARLSSCYVDDPASGRRVVALTRSGGLHVLRYGTDVPEVSGPAATVAAQDVACFSKPDGVLRIVLVAADEIAEVTPDKP